MTSQPSQEELRSTSPTTAAEQQQQQDATKQPLLVKEYSSNAADVARERHDIFNLVALVRALGHTRAAIAGTIRIPATLVWITVAHPTTIFRVIIAGICGGCYCSQLGL